MKAKLFGVTLLVFFAGTLLLAQKQDVKSEMIQGLPMYSVLQKGDIPAIYNPEFHSAEEAKASYFDDEPLLVVCGKNETRAYSTWHLDHHEIVNDWLNGIALAVTW